MKWFIIYLFIFSIIYLLLNQKIFIKIKYKKKKSINILNFFFPS